MNKKVIIVFALIFVFTVVVFRFYQSKKVTAPIVSEKAALQPEQNKIAESKAATDKTADWLEFKNIKYGYFLKFPRDWFIYNTNLADVFIQPRDEKLNDSSDAHAISLEIKVTKAMANSTLDNLIKVAVQDETKEGRTINKEAMKISGEDGYKVMLCGRFECALSKWFVLKNGNFYYFNSLHGEMPQFETITSTFEFLK
jgi:hypothetical protein